MKESLILEVIDYLLNSEIPHNYGNNYTYGKSSDKFRGLSFNNFRNQNKLPKIEEIQLTYKPCIFGNKMEFYYEDSKRNSHLYFVKIDKKLSEKFKSAYNNAELIKELKEYNRKREQNAKVESSFRRLMQQR